MKTPSLFHNPPQARGFSLVEVTLAVGIVAFAFIPVLGLLPVSLEMTRSISEKTHQARILQRLTALAQQTPFAALDQHLTGQVFFFDGDAELLEQRAEGAGEPAAFVYSAVIVDSPGSGSGATSDNRGRLGLSDAKNRFLAVRIARLRNAAQSGPAGSVWEIPFAVSDVRM